MAIDSSGAVTERYYPQGEQINGKNRHYATDKLGSVMQVVNANGSLLGELRYDAYGKRELAVGTQPRFGYAGMFRHEPTGLNLTLYRLEVAVVRITLLVPLDGIKNIRPLTHTLNDKHKIIKEQD